MLYLAYGSNLSSIRLQARIGKLHKVGVASLSGYAFRFHKKSQDGSAKADAWQTHETRDLLWGVLWRIDARQKAVLDRYEGLGYGYTERFETLTVGGRPQAVQLYVAMPMAIQAGLKPYDWYQAFVVRGAQEHGFPPDYVAMLEAEPTRPDPDAERARRNWRLLEET